MDTVHNVITEPARRLEVFTGAGRRRSFSDEDKARIVAEIVTSGDSVSGVARRHGLSPQQLFGWRRQMRESQVGLSEADGLQFVPAVVDVASSASPVRRQRKAPQCKAEPGAGTIEVEIDGVTVRVGRGADVKTVRAVLSALKAGA
jgi:transposase